jgi:hypothetical protein
VHDERDADDLNVEKDSIAAAAARRGAYRRSGANASRQIVRLIRQIFRRDQVVQALAFQFALGMLEQPLKCGIAHLDAVVGAQNDDGDWIIFGKGLQVSGLKILRTVGGAH